MKRAQRDLQGASAENRIYTMRTCACLSALIKMASAILAAPQQCSWQKAATNNARAASAGVFGICIAHFALESHLAVCRKRFIGETARCQCAHECGRPVHGPMVRFCVAHIMAFTQQHGMHMASKHPRSEAFPPPTSYRNSQLPYDLQSEQRSNAHDDSAPVWLRVRACEVLSV